MLIGNPKIKTPPSYLKRAQRAAKRGNTVRAQKLLNRSVGLRRSGKPIGKKLPTGNIRNY